MDWHDSKGIPSAQQPHADSRNKHTKCSSLSDIIRINELQGKSAFLRLIWTYRFEINFSRVLIFVEPRRTYSVQIYAR